MSAGSLPGGASMPASSSRIELAERADSRFAITQPAEPPPTIMKSKPRQTFSVRGETVDMSFGRALLQEDAGYGLPARPASAGGASSPETVHSKPSGMHRHAAHAKALRPSQPPLAPCSLILASR